MTLVADLNCKVWDFLHLLHELFDGLPVLIPVNNPYHLKYVIENILTDTVGIDRMLSLLQVFVIHAIKFRIVEREKSVTSEALNLVCGLKGSKVRMKSKD